MGIYLRCARVCTLSTMLVHKHMTRTAYGHTLGTTHEAIQFEANKLRTDALRIKVDVDVDDDGGNDYDDDVARTLGGS